MHNERIPVKELSKFLLNVFEAPVHPVPCWLMRQAGRYLPEYRALRRLEPDFVKFCFTPELAVEATLQPLRRYPLDAAILFSDILTLLHAQGAELSFVESRGPKLTYESIKNFLSSSPEQTLDRLSPVFETVSVLKQKLPNHITLIGFAGAPWTLMCYLFNGSSSKTFDHAKHTILGHMDDALLVSDYLADLTAHYVMRQIKEGAEVIQIFDSWAGLLPACWVDQFLFRPWKKMVRTIKVAYPQIPIIGFIKGASVYLKEFIETVEVDGVSIDSSVPLDLALSLPSRCVIQGGMDSAFLVKGGDVMLSEAEHYLKAFKNRPYIFNLGHGVHLDTPPEHVSDLIQFVKSYK